MQRHWPPFAWVCFAMCVGVMGTALASPLYPLYQAHWGLQPSHITGIYVAYMGGALASLLFLGRLSDRFGFLPVLRSGLALVTAGVEMDVLGIDYAAFPAAQREAVVHAHPRGEGFKECILCAFANGFKHRPLTTFGTVNADVLVDSDPGFKPLNFVEIIRKSPWAS